jgi:hypothetical protein
LVAVSCVALLATAWSLSGFGGNAKCELTGLIIIGAFIVGLPLALIGGTVVGRLSAHASAQRIRVYLVALFWTLLCDLVSVVLLRNVGVRSPALVAMVSSSIAIVLPATLILSRWTRRYEFLPRARTRAAIAPSSTQVTRRHV